jgi:CheY-like chemotaxis protein
MDKEKILIVEDDKSLQKLYDKWLPEEEYEKRFSENGIDALESYKSWKPDIIILDIGLPEMDGYSVLRKIREENEDENITIIMITGDSDKHKINDCIHLGINDYVVKPFKYKDISNPSICKQISNIVKTAHQEKCHMVIAESAN